MNETSSKIHILGIHELSSLVFVLHPSRLRTCSQSPPTPTVQPISARPNHPGGCSRRRRLAWPGLAPHPRAATGAPPLLSALGPVAGEVNFIAEGRAFCLRVRRAGFRGCIGSYFSLASPATILVSYVIKKL